MGVPPVWIWRRREGIIGGDINVNVVIVIASNILSNIHKSMFVSLSGIMHELAYLLNEKWDVWYGKYEALECTIQTVVQRRIKDRFVASRKFMRSLSWGRIGLTLNHVSTLRNVSGVLSLEKKSMVELRVTDIPRKYLSGPKPVITNSLLRREMVRWKIHVDESVSVITSTYKGDMSYGDRIGKQIEIDQYNYERNPSKRYE